MRGPELEDIYELTPTQQGMLFHCLLEPGSGLYHLQFCFSLEGGLEPRHLEAALATVVSRHAPLRTSFHHEGLSKPLQVVMASAALPLALHDARHLSPEGQEELIQRLLAKDRATPFAFEVAPLARAAVVTRGEERHELLLSYHHLLLDGWSLSSMMAELLEVYRANIEGRSPPRTSRRPYRDFVAWLQARDGSGDERFWRKQLAGFSEPTPLPLPLAGAVLSQDDGREPYGEVLLRLSPEATHSLSELARKQRVSVGVLVQAVWALHLGRFSGTREVVFGVAVSGRPPELAGADAIVGLFINTVPSRVSLPAGERVERWLSALQGQQGALRAFENTPLAEIRRFSEVARERPLFESLLVFENYPLPRSAEGRKERLRLRAVKAVERTHYPLTLVVQPEAQLSFQLIHDRRRLDEGTARRSLSDVALLLERLCAAPPEATLAWLSATQPSVPLPAQASDAKGTLHALFSQQAERTPHAVAVRAPEGALDYQTLEARSNQLAHLLRQHGVGPEVRVGVCLPRSLELYVAVLAILKAGGAYVPLEPDLPPERLRWMAEDSGAPLLLTRSALQERLGTGVRTLCLDTASGELERQPTHPPADVTVDLAYLVYTSGSTGRPKGVMGRHESTVNRLRWMWRRFPWTPDEVCVLKTPLGFVDSICELLSPLLQGVPTLVVADGDEKDPRALLETLRTHGVTRLVLVPSLLRALLELGGGLGGGLGQVLPRLRLCVSSGESLPTSLARALREQAPEVTLLNLYGSSEAAADVTWFDASEGPEAPFVPIGRPIDGTELYLLDDAMAPVPEGAPGELYVGGVALARGYHDRPDLTAERFVPSPFGDGARLYRTGDRARLGAGGALEYLGRRDHQVKVRGMRVELEEVEAVLRAHPDVLAAAVRRIEDGAGGRLVAYACPREDRTLDPVQVLAFARSRLSPQALPSTLGVLPALPLTPSGKLDRLALARLPEGNAPITNALVDAPRGLREEALALLWGELLGLEQVPATATFLELGGHSLLAARLVGRARAELGIELSLREVMDGATVRSMAARTSGTRAQGLPALPRLTHAPGTGPWPLSFAQERLWFLERLHQQGAGQNIALAVRIRGPLAVDSLTAALADLVRRHASLRTAFVLHNGRPVQTVAEDATTLLGIEDFSQGAEGREAAALERIRALAAQPFDLTRAPLARAVLLRLDDSTHLLGMAISHLICDGGSIELLERELWQLYASGDGEPAAALPPLTVEYADYARWQRECLTPEVLEQARAFWRARLGSDPAPIALPTDRPRALRKSMASAAVPLQIPAAQASALKALARERGATLFQALLASFQWVLAAWTGERDLLIGTAVSGRELPELEPLVGLFVNTVAIRTTLEPRETFGALVRKARDSSLEAFSHALPFEQVVEAVGASRSLTHAPLVQVLFVLQRPLPSAVSIGELSVEPLALHAGRSPFDLALELREDETGLSGALTYSTELFDERTAACVVRMLEQAASVAARSPECRLWETSLLSADDRSKLLTLGRGAPVTGATATAHGLFIEQALRTPEAIALEQEDRALTYRELLDRAASIARRLREHGLRPEDRVGVLLEDPLEAVAAILGISLAGGAFLPLEIAHPRSRWLALLGDAQAAVVLTSTRLAQELGEAPLSCLRVDRDVPAATFEPTPWQEPTTPQGLAYVIYTSGSTGQPKGVLVRHEGLCNLAHAQAEAFELHPGSRVLQFASLAFDASVSELFVTLLAGATLVLTRAGAREASANVARLLREREISVATLPPSLLAVSNPEELPHLRTVVSAGEACPQSVVARWAPGRRFINAYGPTELTVCATMAVCSPEETPPPIGPPMKGVTAYVLDSRGGLAAPGAVGELFLGGTGVARGYLGRPDLTAERFVPDPFSATPGARLYRTGDRVRWRTDGQLEFLGRTDEQLKVRGHRIEPAEVEEALRSHPGIQDAAVALAPGTDTLVAYLVQRQPAASPAALRAHLSTRLPGYLVPSVFVELSALPLNTSGKVDRRALPPPPPPERKVSTPPRTAVEKHLARIWREVLRVDAVGVTDSFFALGGHSLAAVRALAEVERLFGKALPLSIFYEDDTLEALARRVEAEGEPEETRSVVLAGDERRPPLFLLHPLGGELLSYQQLARHLGPSAQVIGLRAPGLEAGQSPARTLEALASHHVDTLLQRWPAEGYRLAGWSFGAVVAFEVARQLSARGVAVHGLGLIDADAPLGDLRNDMGEEAAEQLWAWELARQGAEALADSPQLQSQRAVFHAHLEALARYRPSPWQGSVMLLHAARRFDTERSARAAGWRVLCLDGVEERVLDGDHFTILDGSRAIRLAEALLQLRQRRTGETQGDSA